MFYNPMESNGIRVIWRRKGLFRHYALHIPGYGVVEFGEWGIRIVSLAQFEAGQDVKTEREIPMHQYGAVMLRLQFALANPQQYDLGNWNCENFANWLADGKGVSSQVKNIVALGALAGAFALLARFG